MIPTLCVGCGRDHAPGAGCGYAREVTWTRAGAAERWRRLRIFPVVAGALAAGLGVYLVAHPPQVKVLFYAGVVICAAVAALIGGFGTHALIQELRKERWRAQSTDHCDRALAVFVGGELRYAFGESLRHAPVPDLPWASALSSEAALRLGPALRELLDERFLDWLRAEAGQPGLFTREHPGETFALVVAMSVLGLAARGDVTLFSGRYHDWGRGGAKMPDLGERSEVAIEARSLVEGAPRIERALLERALLEWSQAGPQTPISVALVTEGLGEDGLGPRALPELRAEASRAGPPADAALVAAAWERVVEQEPQLAIHLLRHTLPGAADALGFVQVVPAPG